MEPRCSDQKALQAARRIGQRIGPSRIVDDPDILESFGADESGLPAVLPAAAIRARSAQDVAVTLAVASELGVPVTPRGGGTGKSGGAIPLRGGLVLALAGMNRIIDVNKENLMARVQPGVITAALHEATEGEGLFYPPDPASLETCALGGNVAENAGGPRAFKYGVTGNYVLGAEVVLPSGQVLQVGKQTVKGVAGYDVTSLLVGSEGTLGVFTELTLRLVPKPQAVRTLLALFDDAVAAGHAVSHIVARGLVPRVLELLDRASVDTLRAGKKVPIPAGTGALLLIEVDGDADTLDRAVVTVADACEQIGAKDVLAMQTRGEANKLWEARRELSELLGRREGFKLADDVAVPRSAIAEMIQMADKIAGEHGTTSASYGHAGDGNLHLNVLYASPDQKDKAKEAMDKIVAGAVSLGGTITGEHGVGCAKQHLLALEQSNELIAVQRQIKKLFDPKGILNPGKIFPR